jgi:hypothetical protein
MRRLGLLVAMGFGLALAVPAARLGRLPRVRTGVRERHDRHDQCYRGTSEPQECSPTRRRTSIRSSTRLIIRCGPRRRSATLRPPGERDRFHDFHDHVLDSVPGTGHSEFNPLWHVFLIIPSSFDEAPQAAYAAHLPRRCSLKAVQPGANVGATQANGFLRQANEYGQPDGGHASSRTDPDVLERLTGIYGSDGWGSNASERGRSQAR